MTQQNIQTHEIISGLGASLLAISTFLPWATQGDGFSENSFFHELPWFLTGTSLDFEESATYFAHGPAFMGLAAVAAVVIYLNRQIPRREFLLALGAVVVALSLANYFSFSSIINDVNKGLVDGDTKAAIGFGLYLATLGGVGIVSGAIIAPRSATVTPGIATIQSDAPPAASPPQPAPPRLQQQQAPVPSQSPGHNPPTAPDSSGQWWNN